MLRVCFELGVALLAFYVGLISGRRGLCECPDQFEHQGFSKSDFKNDLKFALKYHEEHLRLFFLREEATLRLIEAVDF